MGGKALITGAGHRLGAAMARSLAARGWDVALHYATSHEGAEAVARDCRAEGVQAITLQADLLDEAATQALLPRAVRRLGGPLTLLVNNASIFEYDTLGSATRQSWDRHMES
ncbi:MAG: SDR family NAD(P)-dependent oxidoreductase, partial [Rhodobacteraceae bacterium]|nr:SDR family NAD(P)-dependent oxidoreductase [Paracoccaceae bacterium]